MAFLVVAGITVHVSTKSASRVAVERIGTSTRSFNGSLRTNIRAEKRGWQCVTKLLTDTAANTLEAACANGAHVTCSGDFLGGSVICEVTVGASALQQVAGGFKRTVSLTLREV